MADFARSRQAMVDSQIRTVKVYDERLLAALRETPREAFAPDRLRPLAYVDEDLHIGHGRYLTEPMVLARLLQAAEIGPTDAVLVVGCTTGYAVALVSRLAETVVGLEEEPDFVTHADCALSALEIDNGVVVRGELNAGYPRQAPYDAIVIEGRCGEWPDRLTAQLAEGGRLTAVIDDRGVGKAVLMRRGAGGAVGRRTLFNANVPPLRSFVREAGFQL